MRKLILFMLIVIFIGTFYIVTSIPKPNNPIIPSTSLAPYANPKINTKAQVLEINPEFELTDVDGKIITNKDFLGKIMLVYFGFTYCPDICPTELTKLSTALEKLGEDASKVQAIFITVDPERDDFVQLKSYMQNFNPQIIALNGTLEATEKVAKNYKVYYNKVQNQNDKNYLIDHTSFMYVINENGKFDSIFYTKTTSAEMALKLKQMINQLNYKG